MDERSLENASPGAPPSDYDESGFWLLRTSEDPPRWVRRLGPYDTTLARWRSGPPLRVFHVLAYARITARRYAGDGHEMVIVRVDLGEELPFVDGMITS